MKPKEIEAIEIDLLLEGILRRFGYDFRHYARASLKRRLRRRLKLSGMEHISQMLPAMMHDEAFFDTFLKDMSITVTEMFRDPQFYQEVRQRVIPVLKTYPFVKIWHAGCATGEEIYSLAIVLEEEGFLKRAQIYATDFNTHSLEVAREGIYPLDKIQQFTANYNRAGGVTSFADYYHARYAAAKMDERLRHNVTFAYHNLVTDGVFGEMHLIICRNVLIYFDRTLQNHVLDLFAQSLCRRGFLCLGTKESIEFSEVGDRFDTIYQKGKIYRKKLAAPVIPGQKDPP